MWELDCEEGWVPKNWCVWTVVLEKTLEGSLDYKEIQPVHSEGDQPWDFFGGNDGEAVNPVLWPPHVKSWLIGKESDSGRDWGQEEKGMTENEMAGLNHWLDGRESEWTLVVGDGQGGLACCDSCGRKESDTTEWLNWIELNNLVMLSIFFICLMTPSVCFLWKNICLGLLSIFLIEFLFLSSSFFFFLFWLLSCTSYFIFWKLSPCWVHHLQIFSPNL